MFAKLCTIVAVALPFVQALTVSTPTNVNSGGTVNLNWTTAAGDPTTFSVELINTVFNNQFALANNVDPSLQTLTINMPIVPAGDGYTIEFVGVSNISQIFTTTGGFSIGATVTSSSSSSSSASSGASSSSHSGSGSGTTTSGASTSSTPLASTISQTLSSLSSVASSAISAASSAGSAASASTTAFNGAKAAFGVHGSYALMILGVVAGAAVVGL